MNVTANVTKGREEEGEDREVKEKGREKVVEREIEKINETGKKSKRRKFGTDVSNEAFITKMFIPCENFLWHELWQATFSASSYACLSSSGVKTGTRPIMHLGQVRVTVRLVVCLLFRLV